MSRFTPKILVSCALAGVFASPFTAFATMISKLDEPVTRVVRYGDLDLSRDSGVATLYSRINSAARAVCEPLDVMMLKVLRERFDCRQDAVARAVADVNSPALTSYHLAKTNALAGNER
ncbi:MAG TPA: UrcA family protein [Steroidobacteraceae bacterium]|jgi:UrcA family protein|nr:UrcA family protein [Steroidobacteraceae bacterium]